MERPPRSPPCRKPANPHPKGGDRKGRPFFCRPSCRTPVQWFILRTSGGRSNWHPACRFGGALGIPVPAARLSVRRTSEEPVPKAGEVLASLTGDGTLLFRPRIGSVLSSL